MSTDFGKALKQKLLELGMGNMDTLIGCNEQTIQSLMQDQEVESLPLVYRQFMMHLGKRAGSLFAGTDCFCDYLIGVKEQAQDLLDDVTDSKYKLPKDAFVFLIHQGYQFNYFQTDNKLNDPPVYYYTDSYESPRLSHNTVSEFWTDFIVAREGDEARAEFLKSVGLV